MVIQVNSKALSLYKSNIFAIKYDNGGLDFTGNVCSSGRKDGYLFTPAHFISSDVLWSRLMKGKVTESDNSLSHLPASVPPDSGTQTSHLPESSSDRASLKMSCQTVYV